MAADEVPALTLDPSSRRGRFLDGHEAEEVLVERQRESAGGGVVDGPGGANEVGDTPLEECLGELGASSGVRSSARSGVIPDSQALEKTNFGMLSIRRSSLTESRSPPVKIQPEDEGCWAS